MTIGWHFDNTYSKLSNTFKEDIKPTPVHDPELVILNEQLAADLNLDFSKIKDKDLSSIFSGNSLPDGSNTIAQAYAGHQFGHFTMLGDGRAVDWMRVGFIHGVMNTDNMTISGETIDYGPCAFMDQYHPKTVFSSIDKLGRYAYSNQPPITKWNLTRFAECLIPLIDKNEDTAIKIATDVIDNFQNIYEKKWLNMMRDKLGLFGEDKNDRKLIDDLLNWMEKNKIDYTNIFCHLMDIKIDNNTYKDKTFLTWFDEWKKRSQLNNSSKEKQIELMKKNNPIVVPRNHKVEEALTEANNGSLEGMNKLNDILKNPYSNQEDIAEYQVPAPTTNEKYQTFCGT